MGIAGQTQNGGLGWTMQAATGSARPSVVHGVMTGPPLAVTADGTGVGAWELCKDGTAPALAGNAAVADVTGTGGNAVDARAADRESAVGDGASDVAAESVGEDVACGLKDACHTGAGADAARDNVLVGKKLVSGGTTSVSVFGVLLVDFTSDPRGIPVPKRPKGTTASGCLLASRSID